VDASGPVFELHGTYEADGSATLRCKPIRIPEQPGPSATSMTRVHSQSRSGQTTTRRPLWWVTPTWTTPTLGSQRVLSADLGRWCSRRAAMLQVGQFDTLLRGEFAFVQLDLELLPSLLVGGFARQHATAPPSREPAQRSRPVTLQQPKRRQDQAAPRSPTASQGAPRPAARRSRRPGPGWSVWR
jgi:hypothetical protein